MSVLIISMDVRVSVSCVVSYCLLDVMVTTALYAHGSHLGVFKQDALSFNILRSALDLWGAVLVRASLLLGASVGVSCNCRDGPRRVTKLSALVVFISLLFITYALAKLLMLTELGPLTRRPWTLSLACWTCASSLAVVLLWRLLGKEPNTSPDPSSISRGGDESWKDTERLLGAAGEEEQEVRCERRKRKEEEEEEGKEERKKEGTSQEKSGSGATLGRLLTYCRKDGGLLSVAVLFLLISAVCECP